jgi:SAM-dependent methyltransferase
VTSPSSPEAAPASSFTYVGEELDLFAHAVNWKKYWAGKIAPYLGPRVLEVGAGTGTNTPLLASDRQDYWLCLEPDGALVSRLRAVVEKLPNRPKKLDVMTGDTRNIAPHARFDSVLYIDVLEHIEADKEETARAFGLLAPGGYLVVLSPAHQFLYSPFDKGIGHFRRYSRRTLRDAGPPDTRPVRLFYLDAVGFAASLANRVMLRQSLPTVTQIKFWDSYLVRSSLLVDPLLGHNFGKTVVGIWQKPF